MNTKTAYLKLRAVGMDARYAISVVRKYQQWTPKRFEQAYPYSAEHLGVASWQ